MASRRALLSTLAAGAGAFAAGCLDGVGAGSPADGSTSGSPEPTRSTPTTTTAEPGLESLQLGDTAEGPTDVTVSDARVRKIVYTVDEGTTVHPYPSGAAGSQFLVLDVAASGEEDVAALPLSVRLDGEVAARAERTGVEMFRLGRDPGSSGSLGFRVPVAQVGSGAVEWQPAPGERYRWSLPGSVLADLARAPSFAVRRFEVPDPIGRDARFSATLEVANAGDRDGRFLAAVYDQGPSSLPLVSAFEVDVPVGGSVTREVPGRELDGDRSSLTAILDWGLDRRAVTVGVGSVE